MLELDGKVLQNDTTLQATRVNFWVPVFGAPRDGNAVLSPGRRCVICVIALSASLHYLRHCVICVIVFAAIAIQT